MTFPLHPSNYHFTSLRTALQCGAQVVFAPLAIDEFRKIEQIDLLAKDSIINKDALPGGAAGIIQVALCINFGWVG